MVLMDEWAEFYSGNYQGWIRSPACDWEDIIGMVNLECTVHQEGFLNVMIKNIELGTWTGYFRPDEGIMEGSTGQGDTRFKCVFQIRGEDRNIQGVFFGDIYELPDTLLYEFNFTSNWKKVIPSG